MATATEGINLDPPHPPTPFLSSIPVQIFIEKEGVSFLSSSSLGVGWKGHKSRREGQGGRSAPSQTYEALCPHWPGQQPLAVCFTELGILSPPHLAAQLCVSWERQPPVQGSQGEGILILREGAPGSSQSPRTGHFLAVTQL